MFSRNNERPAPDDRRGTIAPPPGVRDVSAPPGVRDVSSPSGVRDVSAPPPPMPMAPAPQMAISGPDMTVVAAADRVEGTVKVAQSLRVLGTLEGRVEAITVHIEEGSKVHADVTADEVIIAGEYSGKLVCRQRLEVRASGQVAGQVETFRLLFHEGASLDGELRMLKPSADGKQPTRTGATIRSGGTGEVSIRPAVGAGIGAASIPIEADSRTAEPVA